MDADTVHNAARVLAWWAFVLINQASWTPNGFARRWAYDAVTSRPEGVTARVSDEIQDRLTKIGGPTLEPELLKVYQLPRPLWTRQRTWITFVPLHGLRAIHAGHVIVDIEYLPPRTKLRISAVDEPRKPRGGLKIPAMKLPKIAPIWSSPIFAPA